jgi:hypothetical protein
MCFMTEIPEKEDIKSKKLEKENQSNHEEKPIIVNAA